MDSHRQFRLVISLFIGVLIGIFIFLTFMVPRNMFKSETSASRPTEVKPIPKNVLLHSQFMAGPQKGGFWKVPPVLSPREETLTTGHDVFSSPVIWQDRVYAGSLDGCLYAISPGPPPKVLWKFKAGHKIFSTPAVDFEGNVYFGAVDGRVTSVDSGGKKRWEFITRGPVTSSPVLWGDRVYVNGSDGFLYAFDRAGNLRWKADLDNRLGEVSPSPAVDAFGRVVTGSTNGRLYCFNPKGSIAWEMDLGSSVYSTPAVLQDSSVIIAGGKGMLYMISPRGEIVWKVDLGGPVESSAAVDPDRGIYLGLSRAGMVALEFSGKVRWRYDGAGPVNGSAAIDNEGNLYFGDEKGIIHSLDPGGKPRWTVKTGGGIFSSPSLGRGFLVVGSEDDLIHFIYDGK